jgi:hypothetical protein
MAIHLAARLTNPAGRSAPQALSTTIAMHDATDFKLMISGRQALSIAVANVYEGGLMLPDKHEMPSFEYAERWAKALAFISLDEA